MQGPNPEKLEGSVELEIAANVLPQKLFSQKIILASFSGIPLTIQPHFLANLFAVSPPSTPMNFKYAFLSISLVPKHLNYYFALLQLLRYLYSLAVVYRIQTVCKHILHIFLTRCCKTHVMLTSKYLLVLLEPSKFLDDNVLG